MLYKDFTIFLIYYIPITAANVETKAKDTPIIIADNDDEYPEVDDDDPYGINYSVHSEKQSKFIDFINNRIAPIS